MSIRHIGSGQLVGIYITKTNAKIREPGVNWDANEQVGVETNGQRAAAVASAEILSVWR